MKTETNLNDEKDWSENNGPSQGTARRDWIRLASTASAGAILYLLTGNAKRLYAQSVDGDLGILTAALYLENEAVAAYQAGAESKLLSPGILKVAVAFQSDHKYHRDGLSGVLKSLGVTPSGPEKKYDFGHLRSENDILHLARDREHGAVQAYGTLASNILTRPVLNFGANVLADEVRHYTILNAVLGGKNY
ncbi:MAG: ferritin-like domain-containing protein [Terriglobales bacterium]